MSPLLNDRKKAAAFLHAACLLPLIVASSSSSPAAGAPNSSASTSMGVALREMQQARYFAFVMLLRMAQQDSGALLFSSEANNTTFLVPSDRALAAAPPVPERRLANFLRRHIIPSALLSDDLARLPNRTLIPTALPGYAVSLTARSSGAHPRQLYLNNARLVCPDICTQDFSVSCHGIDAVLHDDIPPPARKKPRSPPASCTQPPQPTPPSSPSPPSPPVIALPPSPPDSSLPSVPAARAPASSFGLAPAATPAPEPAVDQSASSRSKLAPATLLLLVPLMF